MDYVSLKFGLLYDETTKKEGRKNGGKRYDYYYIPTFYHGSYY